ncbi:hypothetical protein LDENG_00037140 [Lucifuga dentata]|nr:hypothetical protein LDENG_00037140 [Lucifuga dentata]
MLMPVCVCELIIAAPLVFSGWSSRISLRLSTGWDHRAGIVLACGEPAEMDLKPCTDRHQMHNMEVNIHLSESSVPLLTTSTFSTHQLEPSQQELSLQS